jgi:hypothetical protein
MLIDDKAKEFKKEDAHGTEGCAICLENFSEGDGKMVAELGCSNKHIFHVDCLKTWV